MLSLNGVSAWIEVDGNELEQYSVEEDLHRSRVTCWIATQAHKGPLALLVSPTRWVVHPWHDPLPANQHGGFSNAIRTIVQTGQTQSATSSHPFMFAKLELTDEEDYLNQASTHLGESSSSVPGHDKVHERTRKAVTHCVSYGPEMKTATMYACHVKYLDGKTPLVTFIFRYRDFDLLQANGIIPKLPPAKKRALVSEDVLDLTADDTVKLKSANGVVKIVDGATQKGMRVLSKISNPSRESEIQPAKKIKKEKRSAPIGEVIDLT